MRRGMIEMKKCWRRCRAPRRLWNKRFIAAFVTAAIGVCMAQRSVAQDVSQPAILQLVEARWNTLEDRMADIFQVGYGQMWLTPPQRADSGNLSVGYDLFDRFDLGS